MIVAFIMLIIGACFGYVQGRADKKQSVKCKLQSYGASAHSLRSISARKPAKPKHKRLASRRSL